MLIFFLRNMRHQLEKYLSDETWIVEDDLRTKVLTSAQSLIEFFRSSLKILSSFTKDQALYDLYLLFKKYLHQYAVALSDKIGYVLFFYRY